MMKEIDGNIADLNQLQAKMYEDFATLAAAYGRLSAAASAVGAAAGGDSQAALFEATKNMQETQMSFNLV